MKTVPETADRLGADTPPDKFAWIVAVGKDHRIPLGLRAILQFIPVRYMYGATAESFSERQEDIATELGVTRKTVSAAFRLAVALGYLVKMRHHGSGRGVSGADIWTLTVPKPCNRTGTRLDDDGDEPCNPTGTRWFAEPAEPCNPTGTRFPRESAEPCNQNGHNRVTETAEPCNQNGFALFPYGTTYGGNGKDNGSAQCAPTDDELDAIVARIDFAKIKADIDAGLMTAPWDEPRNDR